MNCCPLRIFLLYLLILSTYPLQSKTKLAANANPTIAFTIYITSLEDFKPKSYSVKFVNLDNPKPTQLIFQYSASLKDLTSLFSNDKPGSKNLSLDFRHIECETIMTTSFARTGIQFFFATDERTTDPQKRMLMYIEMNGKDKAHDISFFEGFRDKCLKSNKELSSNLELLMDNMMRYDVSSQKKVKEILDEKFSAVEYDIQLYQQRNEMELKMRFLLLEKIGSLRDKLADLQGEFGNYDTDYKQKLKDLNYEYIEIINKIYTAKPLIDDSDNNKNNALFRERLIMLYSSLWKVIGKEYFIPEGGL